MATKQVSVRLSATGGRQVKAELEGVGEAGARGFGRLSREMEGANLRLAAFARRARLAMAAAATAITAAATAMIRSGLQTVDAQAKLAASLDTTVASIQVLERAGDLAGVSMGQIEQATVQLSRRLSQAAAGTGPAVAALDRLRLSAADLQALPLDQRIALIQDRLAAFVPQAQRAAVASQLFGDRAALVFTRIDTATLRQATQDVRDFGVVVSDQDAAQIERTNDAISRLGLIWRGLSNQLAVAAAPALEAVANAMAAVARTTGPLGIAIRGLFDNLGRLASIAATFAAFMAGRWVAGFAAAALSVRGLATALVVLRGAIIRTGIGALIVGAGELVYQFSRLVQGAGSFGKAMRLLKDVAVEAWDRIALTARSAWLRVTAGWAVAQSAIYDGLQGVSAAVTAWANATIGTFRGAFDAVKVIWSALPQAIGDFAYQAANGLIGGVEAMLNAVVSRINRFITGLNSALALLPSWATGEDGVRIGTLAPVGLAGIDNPFAGAASATSTAVAQALRSAMDQTYLDTPDLFGSMADAARSRAASQAQTATLLAEAAARPRAAWQALLDAVTGTGAQSEIALSTAAAAAGELAEALSESAQQARGAGGAARQAGADAAAAVTPAQTAWREAAGALAEYAKAAVQTGKQIGDALVSAFRGAEDAIVAFVTTGKLDFTSLANSILADITRIAVRQAILGPVANALAGGMSSGGSLLAGIFHDGGIVGQPGAQRRVPAFAFAGAERYHNGGFAGLRPDEVPAILQRGERVLSRRELAAAPNAGTLRPVHVTMNITTPDAGSFRLSQGQIMADARRAMMRAQRNS